MICGSYMIVLRTFNSGCVTAQKMKFSIKDFFSKCDQIRSFLRIWSHLLEKSLMEHIIFLCSVCLVGSISLVDMLNIPKSTGLVCSLLAKNVSDTWFG